MHITNRLEVSSCLFIVLIEVTFPSHLFSAYTMGLVPVQFGHAKSSIR
jgi:hypothetical protein